VCSPSKVAALRAAKRRPSVYPTFDPMPFVGVFMVLFFIFMLIPPSLRFVPPADLPEARSTTFQPRALREDAIRIAVARNGRCFFGSVTAKPSELPDLIRTALRGGSERKAYLLAGARVKNGGVGIVVDQIRRAGIINVVILVNQPPRPTSDSQVLINAQAGH
jgi:biopolymer transport protein ExbD